MTRHKHCDYEGICKNKAYKEVYPSMLGGKYKNKGWSYLCRKHFLQEKKRFKGKLPYCSAEFIRIILAIQLYSCKPYYKQV